MNVRPILHDIRGGGIFGTQLQTCIMNKLNKVKSRKLSLVFHIIFYAKFKLNFVSLFYNPMTKHFDLRPISDR